jgi:hypothetical protein
MAVAGNQAYLANVKASIYKNGDRSKAVYYTNLLISRAVQKYLPIATNQSIYEFSKMELAFDEKLLNLDPQLVLYVELGNQYGGNNNDNEVMMSLYGQIIATGPENAGIIWKYLFSGPKPQ